MLSIKLKPVGRKRQIIYRVVVAEKRSKLKGKSIENLGWIDPRRDKFEINKERAKYWIETGGAQPTDTVYNLFVRAGVVEGPKRPVHAKKKISEEDVKKDKEASKAVSKEFSNETPSEEKTESEEEEAKEETPKEGAKEGAKEEVSADEASEERL